MLEPIEALNFCPNELLARNNRKKIVKKKISHKIIQTHLVNEESNFPL